MDPTKPSLTSKVQQANNGGVNDSFMEETVQGRDAVGMERQWDSDSRETDVEVSAAAEVNQHGRRAADRQKYSTIGYQRRTKEKVVTDFATINKGSSTGNKPRTALRQVLFSQGVSDKTSEERSQRDMMKQELEALTVPTSFKWTWNDDNHGSTLENSWTDIVHSHSTMSKMQRHQQEALWEFVNTELIYINKLIVIKDLVMAALSFVRQRGHLTEVTPEMLFSNLPLILSAHQLFWQEVIYPMLHDVRKTGKPFDPTGLEAGCMQFQERFSSYQHYCWEEEDSLELSRRQMESNPHFVSFVEWVENHPQCRRMRLGYMQASPHQRITKYPLLLKAVLKNTQDTNEQLRLRAMLSSVNTFLEGINEYLRLKDEELALSISAQRVEGYEVEGINEEIDKHVRELCHFDLTCPIKGVNSKVIRKLLLEENLKIRGRKDSKLEVVALLFSDVLLMTKVQKKGERLKVVRPPLALDRTYCIALKDGYSFVLVEVGELQSVMNVFIFLASSSESCSLWVSTLHKAKETLRKLQLKEYNRLMSLNGQQVETKRDIDLDEQTVSQPRRKSVTSAPHSVNGFVDKYLPQDKSTSTNQGLNILDSQSFGQNHQVLHKRDMSQWQESPRYEWIEMKKYQSMNHIEEDEGKVVESKMTFEKQGLTLNHRAKSVPNLDLFTQTAEEPVKHPTTRIPNLITELPDVDYPMEDDSTSLLQDQPIMPKGVPVFVGQRPPEKSITTNSDLQFVNQGSPKNSRSSQPGKYNLLPDVFNFSKNVTSPGLRRRRPAIKGPLAPAPKPSLQVSGKAWCSTRNLSSSNLDSENNISLKRNSVSSGTGPDSQRVLTLGSLQQNQGMFWKMSDTQNHSESEMSDGSPCSKRPNLKAQRSTSNPTLNTEAVTTSRLHSNSYHTSHKDGEIRSPVARNNSSPLIGLLERAKERGVHRHMSKRDQISPVSNAGSRVPPPSPAYQAPPSPSLTEVHLDLEEPPVLMRQRARAVSDIWKEQHVDGDDNDTKPSHESQEGQNVDWAGWCFDDEEVMDRLQPRGEGLLVGISRSLASLGFSEISEQEDGEYSQV